MKVCAALPFALAPALPVVLGTIIAACTPRGADDHARVVAPAPPVPVSSSTGAPPSAVLPRNEGRFAPSQLEVAASGDKLDGSVVTETESCAGCHADAAAGWRASAHAFASFNNPVYRVAIDRFRGEVDRSKSQFCAGCHDVALLVDGAMTGEVAPDDSRGHGGVTCRVCHGIESVRPDGNASYTLASSPVPIPREGDAESLRLHKERMALSPLKTAALCGSCHRAFLTEATGNAGHLVGQDELGAWSRSVYAGSPAAHLDEPIEARRCQDCHMPKEDAPLGDAAAKEGRIASHRFLGGHTWLSAMRGDPAELEREQAMLRGAASIDVAAAVAQDGSRTLPADGAPVVPGRSTVFDVVVKNQRVGHKFPGGVLDAQDVWIELTVTDARGTVLAEAGTLEEKSGDDPTAHRLRAVQIGDDGRPLLLRETDRFRTPAYSHVLAPRDAEVVRYRFDAPRALELPLAVRARLRHRTRNLMIYAATCADVKTPRGAAFKAAVRRRGSEMDPCAPEPVTDVADSTVFVGTGWRQARDRTLPAHAPAADWQRLYDHGLGMLHALGENVDSGRPSLERALAILPPIGAERERAMVEALMGELAAREGRTGEAVGWLDLAQRDAPEASAATARIHGDALGAVWRWREATDPLREATALAPLDDTVWADLAVAAGSAGDPRGALDATRRGLALQPRDPDMLRVQALALESLGAPAEDVARAREAFLAFRTPDDAPRWRSQCSKDVPGCALERVPVHVHGMRGSSAAARLDQ